MQDIQARNEIAWDTLFKAKFLACVRLTAGTWAKEASWLEWRIRGYPSISM